FFFQAEDGIRDATVTGVQTCALPISSSQATSRLNRLFSSPQCSARLATTRPPRVFFDSSAALMPLASWRRTTRDSMLAGDGSKRSEERRVGKEWGWRGARG